MTSKNDFGRWRPSYHLICSKGWMNDPCAPGYDPSTKTYHVGFQWNPQSAEWGDIVWGRAHSKDLVTWDVSDEPCLEKDTHYDHAGVFTGCWVPRGVRKDEQGGSDSGECTIVYTSVSRLPIHYTLDYHRGCETLSLGVTKDGGKSWEKLAANPVLPGPPKESQVTGWRDPFVAPWPRMAGILRAAGRRGTATGEGSNDSALFGIISGGLKGQTPTTWLYAIDAKDLARWEYVGPVVTPGLNFAPSRWTGDLGVNWEVTNFASLSSDGQDEKAQDFLILGAEGCKHPFGGAGTVPGTKRCNRAQLWIAVDPEASPEEGGALMKYSYGGVFDHGLFYAANGFHDPVSNQHIVVGWVTEEDLPVDMQVKQGWSGFLSLPRVVSLASVRHVSRATRSALEDITSVEAVAEDGHDGLYTVYTLGVAPDPRLEKLRAAAAKAEVPGVPLELSSQRQQVPLTTSKWEAYAEFSRASTAQRVGLVIDYASTSQATTLYFSPQEETFVVSRPDVLVPSTHGSGDGKAAAAVNGQTGTTNGVGSGDEEPHRCAVKLQQEKAPFTLFTKRGVDTGVEGEEESLKVHLFYDTSVLEVFVNGRAAITTRVYLDDVSCSALRFFAEGRDSTAVLERAVVWDGLSNEL